jgi:hypothetical protein
MKYKITTWMICLLPFSLCNCNREDAAPIVLSESEKLVDELINMKIHDCSDAFGVLYKNGIKRNVDLKFKILIDSALLPIDTFIVNRVLSEYVSLELVRKTKFENKALGNLSGYIQIDMSKAVISSADSIAKFGKNIANILQDPRDTIVCSAIRLYRPAINMEKNKAVLPFFENNNLKFVIYQKDSVWAPKLTVASEIE